MNIKLKNISDNEITLFVRRNNVDERITIAPGYFVLADNYETKTMLIFKRKNLIATEPIQMDEESVDSNHVMTQDSSVENLEFTAANISDIEYFKERLLKAFKAPDSFSTKQENPTRLDIVEGEVAKYIEDGYIKGEWSDDEVSFLKKNYPTKGRKYCSTKLNRNETSVQKKINSLRIRKKKKK